MNRMAYLMVIRLLGGYTNAAKAVTEIRSARGEAGVSKQYLYVVGLPPENKAHRDLGVALARDLQEASGYIITAADMLPEFAKIFAAEKKQLVFSGARK